MPTVNAIRLCALAMLLPAGSAHAASAAYPMRPVRVIVPYAAGGSSDFIARLLGPRLSERLGQQFVIDNRAGGGTLIGTDIAAHAPADGHTLLVATPPLVVNPALYARVDYVVDRDFAAVCNMAASSNLLVVHPSLNVTTVKDLIALARARPDHYTYGSSGIGGAAHLAMALFTHEAGIALVHVPYKGGSLAVADLLAGRVNLAMANLTTALPHLRSGRLRGLAIGTAKRSALLPDMPTLSEAGVPGYEANNWNGMVVPHATPRAVIRTLHSAIAAALREPAMAERVASAGLDVIGDTPEEFSAYLKSEAGKWGKLVKTAGIKAE